MSFCVDGDLLEVRNILTFINFCYFVTPLDKDVHDPWTCFLEWQRLFSFKTIQPKDEIYSSNQFVQFF